MPMTHYVYVYALECHYGGPVLFGVFLQKKTKWMKPCNFLWKNQQL